MNTITIQIDTHSHSISDELGDWLEQHGSNFKDDPTPNMESETWDIPVGETPLPISEELCQCAWVRGADGKLSRFSERVS